MAEYMAKTKDISPLFYLNITVLMQGKLPMFYFTVFFTT